MRQRQSDLRDSLSVEAWQRLRRLELGEDGVRRVAGRPLQLDDGLPVEDWQSARRLQVSGDAGFAGTDGQDQIVGGAGHDDLDRGRSGRLPSSAWGGSPARREAQEAMQATPMDPEVFRYLPVTGPAIDAYEAAQRGEVLPALGHGALAIGDGLLMATGVGVAGAVARRTAWNTGRMTGNAVRHQMKRRGVTPKGHDLHHTFELNGIPRNVENWRNHPAFVKPLPKSDHKRLHGRDGDLPEFNALQKLVVGTPRWMKTLPTGLIPRLGQAGVSAADAARNPPPARPRPPAPYGERPLR